MLGRKLKELREQKRMSQAELANILDVAQQTVASWERDNSSPNYEILKKIAKYFYVSTDYLLGNVNPETLRAYMDEQLLSDGPHPAEEIQWVKHGIKIPVLGTIVAGIPLEAVQEILDYEEIPAAMAKHGEYFALRVKGRSMEPNYIEGDTVIVRKEHTVDSGRVAVVLINGEEATLKKVKISPEGITLIGFNPVVYEPHYYSNKEIKELPVQIIGEVVELRRKV